MPNRLARETSPYLLQHAHNPVDWYPWGDEALARAQAEDKPIFLSVGYSACHWCHVMERESFEDADIAALMNELFVCIKVDREERPDLDEIYMRAVQAFQDGRGGWPMSVFCTPDGKPYWGGTYFPPERRGGMPGFPEVLREMASLYHRGETDRITEQVVAFLDRSGRLAPGDEGLQPGWLERVAAAAQAAFDAQDGGFGTAPKFPPHGTLAALLAHWRVSGHPASLRMAADTLDGMAKGGMYDLLAGGFARYSVDAEWRVPHFEKMLYDNAQLVPAYVDAWIVTGRPHYARVVRETLAWCDREMSVADGGFAASTDADSEGEEGRHFVWTPAQIAAVLGEDGARVAALLQVTPEGTFEHGSSVLRLERPLEALEEADRQLLQRAIPKLRASRERRVAPARDDKVITAWNALTVSAFARAGFTMSEPAWIERAVRAARFLLDRLVVDGRLMRTYKNGRAHLPAYADDHAALVNALLDVYEATFETDWLEAANAWADTTVDLFASDEGPLYYVGEDAPPLVTRSQNPLGGAEPGANALAALAFVRLSHLSMRTDLGARAETILRAYQPMLTRGARAVALEAIAAHWRVAGGLEIGLVGGVERCTPLLDEIRRRFLPFAVRAVTTDPVVHPRLPWMQGRSTDEGVPTAWVCEGYSCRVPTTVPEELGAQLDAAVTPAEPIGTSAVRVRAPALPSDPAAWLGVDAPLTLDRLRGHVVVLDFFTYCCINCLHVLPELAAVEEAFAGEPVVVIGVHAAKFTAEKETENVLRAVRRHRIRHPVVVDPEHTLWSAYAVRSWPTLAILDATGRIAWQGSGETSRDELIRRVRDLLDEGRERGVLANRPVWRVAAAAPQPGLLAFPGKVAVWPDPTRQDEVDPFADGRLYIADTGHDRILECVLRRGDDGWPVAELSRTFGGFRMPQGMARLGDVLYVADTENHSLRAVDLASGAVRTLAGTGRRGAGGRIDRPLNTDLRSPWDVAVVGTPEQPVVFVAMAGAHQIWVYLGDRDQIGPFAGSGREDHIDGPVGEAALAQPSGLFSWGRWLLFADSEVSSIRAIDLQDRSVVTIVGQGLFDFGDVDGVGADVRLQHPLGVTAVGETLYVADTFNHKIKAIDVSEARARTVVGGTTDVLYEPGGLTRLGEFLVVADTNNHRIRAVHVGSGTIRDLPIVSRPGAGPTPG